jgi:ankyrin repeat protein
MSLSLIRIKYGYTPLLIASCNGHERVVSLLIERGANIHLQNNVSI